MVSTTGTTSIVSILYTNTNTTQEGTLFGTSFSLVKTAQKV